MMALSLLLRGLLFMKVQRDHACGCNLHLQGLHFSSLVFKWMKEDKR